MVVHNLSKLTYRFKTEKRENRSTLIYILCPHSDLRAIFGAILLAIDIMRYTKHIKKDKPCRVIGHILHSPPGMRLRAQRSGRVK